MTILFVLLTFLVIISIRYFIEPKSQPALEPEIVAKPQAPRVKREYGFEIPQDYCFHLGHTWVSKEGANDARVGVDKFVTNLMGKIDHIEVRGTDRWVRQGQKLITLTSGGTSVDLLSPVEGVVMAINNDVLRDPSLVTNDPYKNGWIAMVKSPDLNQSEESDPGLDGRALDALQRHAAECDAVASESRAGAGWRRPRSWVCFRSSSPSCGRNW